MRLAQTLIVASDGPAQLRRRGDDRRRSPRGRSGSPDHSRRRAQGPRHRRARVERGGGSFPLGFALARFLLGLRRRTSPPASKRSPSGSRRVSAPSPQRNLQHRHELRRQAAGSGDVARRDLELASPRSSRSRSAARGRTSLCGQRLGDHGSSTTARSGPPDGRARLQLSCRSPPPNSKKRR